MDLVQKVNHLRAKQGKTVHDACKAVGIEQSLYFTWRKKFGVALEADPEPARTTTTTTTTDMATAPTSVSRTRESHGKLGPRYVKQPPDLAFLEFRRHSALSIEEQLDQVTRERDELKQILIGILSGHISPSELLEGMFKSHLEERIRASAGKEA